MKKLLTMIGAMAIAICSHAAVDDPVGSRRSRQVVSDDIQGVIGAER